MLGRLIQFGFTCMNPQSFMKSGGVCAKTDTSGRTVSHIPSNPAVDFQYNLEFIGFGHPTPLTFT